MDHPDFRAYGKIFATLGWPDEHWGVVKLSPEEQAKFVRDQPAAFAPVKVGWGRSGSTQIHLASIDEPTLRNAIAAAGGRLASKPRTPRSNKQRNP